MRTLSDLPLGKRARIGRVCLKDAMGRRLSELGFLPGSDWIYIAGGIYLAKTTGDVSIRSAIR